MTELLPVKPFQETLDAGMCGPAALKMVFEYYGLEKTEEELAQLCGVTPDLGTTNEDMQGVAQGLGFEAEIYKNCTFDDIQKWLDRKVPVIVDWFTPCRNTKDDSMMPDGHASVVVGLDAEYIYILDSEIGRIRKIQRDDFMRVWFDFKGPRIISGDDIELRHIIAVYKK